MSDRRKYADRFYREPPPKPGLFEYRDPPPHHIFEYRERWIEYLLSPRAFAIIVVSASAGALLAYLI